MTGSKWLAAAALTVVLLAACSGEDRATFGGSSKFGRAEVCLTGGEPEGDEATLPAIAVKVENNPVAYPLSGLEKAEVVYEELVEGGITRFLAMYQCTDTSKVGPVRSSRQIDPGIMKPTTHILAAAGGNNAVRKTLRKQDIFLIDEQTGNGALRRISRPGISSEHTLYGDTEKIRKLGSKSYSKPPPGSLFEWGDLPDGGKKTKRVVIQFSGATAVEYRWKDGGWLRFDDGEPLMAESGGQIQVDNVIIEQHTYDYSKITDVAGNPSTIIKDKGGTGKAILFRDGRAFSGKWIRERGDDPVRFETASGDEMVLAPGTTWIELVPDNKGDVKGSFRF